MASAAALKASPLFKGFTDTGLSILAGIAVDRAFPKGGALFVENADGDSMFVIVSGSVRISAKNPAGQEVVLGEVGAGDSLGEIALLQAGPRMCSAVALAEVAAIEFKGPDFQKLMASKPQACIKLLMAIVSQFGRKLADNRDALRSLLPKA